MVYDPHLIWVWSDQKPSSASRNTEPRLLETVPPQHLRHMPQVCVGTASGQLLHSAHERYQHAEIIIARFGPMDMRIGIFRRGVDADCWHAAVCCCRRLQAPRVAGEVAGGGVRGGGPVRVIAGVRVGLRNGREASLAWEKGCHRFYCCPTRHVSVTRRFETYARPPLAPALGICIRAKARPDHGCGSSYVKCSLRYSAGIVIWPSH